MRNAGYRRSNYLEEKNMDKRLKNIVDNLDEIKIDLDAPFMFHCTMCGECCENREDILLTPKDLYKMARELNLTPEQFYEKYCEGYIGNDSRMPIIRLNPIGMTKRCPLLSEGKCIVHKAKPAVCAMFPIGRCIVQEKSQNLEEIDADQIQYIYMDPECGDKAEIHTVREWLTSFGIPIKDEYFLMWQRCVINFSALLREIEKHLPQKTMDLLWNAVFSALYLHYDMEKEFFGQFQENIQKLSEMFENIMADMNFA